MLQISWSSLNIFSTVCLYFCKYLQVVQLLFCLSLHLNIFHFYSAVFMKVIGSSAEM